MKRQREQRELEQQGLGKRPAFEPAGPSREKKRPRVDSVLAEADAYINGNSAYIHDTVADGAGALPAGSRGGL